MQNSLSVVIPSYNEENRLPATLERVAGYLQRRPGRKSEILVVALLLTVPVVNLLAPVTATAVMVHLFELWRTRGQAA